MIKVRLLRMNQRIVGFIVKGHANYDEYGNQTESFYNGQKILSAIYNSNGQIKTLQDDRFVISFE